MPSKAVGKRSDRVGIIADILRSTGIPKTRHRARMNHHSLCGYLDFLTSQGFLEEVRDNGRVTYKRTQRGLNLLQQIDSVQHMLAHDEIREEVKT